MRNAKRFLLIILDGWGLVNDPTISAIESANTPFFDSLIHSYPNSTLVTHGLEVGLPDGQMGNSEVGHMNLGAGRVVYQELARINKSIEDKSFFQNPVLLKAAQKCKAGNGRLHLLGLVSEGGVHSHLNHLLALIDFCKEQEIPEVYIHAFTDGRDVGPTTSLDSLIPVLEKTKDSNVYLKTIVGRYYAMDRDQRWERISKAYHAMVNNKGQILGEDEIEDAIRRQYEEGITDEFLNPICISHNGSKGGNIKNGDTLLFFNFRTDRPRQMTRALIYDSFQEQNMEPLDLSYYSMTRYDETFKEVQVLFDKDIIKNTIGEKLAEVGKTQMRVAETEKYPHVTFFFSGGDEIKFEGEHRKLAPSPKVATYDLQPEMSANEVKTAVISSIEKDVPDFICLNFANTDMVGHTGVFSAAVKAAEVVDSCLSELVPIALKNEYELFIIADHGNADIMYKEDGSPHTAHTMSPVPVIFVSKQADNFEVKEGKLADIAPSILWRLGIDIPDEMDGNIIISKK